MKYVTYIPIIGCAIFIGLYGYATQIYPGGSNAFPDAVGFDMMHNYWCDLMGSTAKNGMANPATLVAKIAMITLSLSLMIFFFLFSKYIPTTRFWNNVIRISGTLSMLIAIFIFTALHDIVIIVAGFLGIIALIGIFKSLVDKRLIFHLRLGVFTLLLMVLNNVIYFLTNNLTYLPILQKITFLVFLSWVVSMNWIFIKKSKS